MTDPSQLWALVNRGPGSDFSRAVLRTAAAIADRLATDDTWHQVALATMTILNQEGAFLHLAAAPTPVPAVDPDQAHTWLSGTDGDTTVAQRLGFLDPASQAEPPNPLDLVATLVASAQQARVFAPGRRLSVVAAAEADPPSVRVLVGIGPQLSLASRPLPLDSIVDPTLDGIAAASSILHRLGTVVDDLLAAHAAARPMTFPRLDLDDPPTVAELGPAPATSTDQSVGRSR